MEEKDRDKNSSRVSQCGDAAPRCHSPTSLLHRLTRRQGDTPSPPFKGNCLVKIHSQNVGSNMTCVAFDKTNLELQSKPAEFPRLSVSFSSE